MAKYRIKQKGGCYYPQRRFMFIWWDMCKRETFVYIWEAKSFLDTFSVKPKVKYYPYP